MIAMGTLASSPAGIDLRQHLIPLVSVYALFLLMLFTQARSSLHLATAEREPEPAGSNPTPWGRLVRHVVVTVTAGYLTFLAIVLLYYFALGGQDRAFVAQALWGGAFLAFAVAAPAFLLLSWLANVARSARRTRRGRMTPPGRG